MLKMVPIHVPYNPELYQQHFYKLFDTLLQYTQLWRLICAFNLKVAFT